MKYLFHLGHPAHFHLFKFVIKELKDSGHDIHILIKKKDVLEDLLRESGLEFHNLLPKGRKDSKVGIAWGLIRADLKMIRYARRVKPDMMIGTSIVNSHAGKILGIPVINVNEDDATVVPLYSKFSYPWSTVILSPAPCNNWKWENKTIKYNGYHELAYLHPSRFVPDKKVIKKYINPDNPYFIIRFAKLTAHHDSGINGITTELAHEIISQLKTHGNIYITSEIPLDQSLEPFRIAINPIDMHHLLAFAQMYIGDSQTMAAEAGVLGTPFLRFNDFVGRIGYLNELENTYQLGYGFLPSQKTEMLSKINALLNIRNIREQWLKKRTDMLSQKIDLSAFLVWFIQKFPESVNVMRNNPGYQNNFI